MIARILCLEMFLEKGELHAIYIQLSGLAILLDWLERLELDALIQQQT